MSDDLPAVAQEIATIQQQMRDDPRGYRRDEPLQARYRDLIDAQAGGGPVPALPSAAAAELRELEAMMRNRGSAYWRGRDATRLQARYRDLIDSGITAPRAVSPADAWRATPEQAIAQLPAATVREWQESGHFAAKLKLVQDHLQLVYWGIRDPQRAAAFEVSFKALPEGARVAALREMGVGIGGFTKDATTAELDAFSAMGGGAAEAAKAWGAGARRKLGRAMARVMRVQENMTQMDRAGFDRWWAKTLTPRERVCVLWSLASL